MPLNSSLTQSCINTLWYNQPVAAPSSTHSLTCHSHCRVRNCSIGKCNNEFYPWMTLGSQCDCWSPSKLNHWLPTLIKIEKVPAIVPGSISIHEVCDFYLVRAWTDKCDTLCDQHVGKMWVVDVIALCILIALSVQWKQKFEGRFDSAGYWTRPYYTGRIIHCIILFYTFYTRWW